MRHATPRILTPWASSRRDLRIYPLPNQSAVCALSESGEILSLSLLFQFSPIPVPPPVSVLRCCVGCAPPPGPGLCRSAVPSLATAVCTIRCGGDPPPTYHLRAITAPPPYQYQHHAIAPPSPCHHRAITVPSPYRHRTTVAVVPPSDHYSPIG